MNKFGIERRSKIEALKGIKPTEETKKKMSKNRKGKCIGKDHPNWKGDDVGYHSLHGWIKNHKPKPKECEICGKKTNKLDCSNKNHEYKRNIDDFQWVCRSCHMLYDNNYRMLD